MSGLAFLNTIEVYDNCFSVVYTLFGFPVIHHSKDANFEFAGYYNSDRSTAFCQGIGINLFDLW